MYTLSTHTYLIDFGLCSSKIINMVGSSVTKNFLTKALNEHNDFTKYPYNFDAQI